MNQTQKPTPDKKEVQKGCLIIIVLLVLIILLFFGVRSCFTEEESDKQEQEIVIEPKFNEDDALYISQKCVEGYIKNPGSAQFPTEGNVTKLNDSTFNVVSYVDAHNSYGALGRLHYVCLVILNPETQKGRCENMQVAENE